MSLHYVLDGYNIIKNPEFPLPNYLEDQKYALLKIIQSKKLCGNTNNKVSVVFDGGGKLWDIPVDSRRRFEIIFSFEQSADQRIKEIVTNVKNPKIIVVVSNDRQLRSFISAHGAKAMYVGEFLKKDEIKKQAQRKRRVVKGSSKAGLSYTQEYEINQELKKIWLK